MHRLVRVVWTDVGPRLAARDLEAALASLPTDERRRILARTAWQAAHASAVGHRLLRALVEETWGAPIPVERNADGRPELVDQPHGDANLSHARDLVAVAVNTRGRVGVDVEVERDVLPGVAQRCFTRAERAWIGLAEDDAAEARTRFIRLWTLKESYVKATGQGVMSDLQSIEFTLDGDTARVTVHGRALARWCFRSWRVGTRAWLSVCVENTSAPHELARVPSPLG